jgi:hypothetical protein
VKATVRTLGDLGDGIVLAPERWLAADESGGDGVPLGELVVERGERASATNALVLDTTHARDGILDIAAAVRAGAGAKSSKKTALAGDLVVSRLRPYLRQIAFVHPRAIEAAAGRPLALSSEFYVLSAREKGGGDDVAFLLPFLLGPSAQAILAAAQEGGHHPRVPRASLFALRVPKEIVRRRRAIGAQVRASLEALYAATARYQGLLGA